MMAEKIKYRATNIETGEEHIGNVDELSALLDASTGVIYRTATAGTHIHGIWGIDRITPVGETRGSAIFHISF